MLSTAVGLFFLTILLLFSQYSITVQAEETIYSQKAYPLSVMDDIVVTATKAERKAADLTTNATIITEEGIKKHQPSHVTDLLRHVPGLTINGSGSEKIILNAGFRGMPLI